MRCVFRSAILKLNVLYGNDIYTNANLNVWIYQFSWYINANIIFSIETSNDSFTGWDFIVYVETFPCWAIRFLALPFLCWKPSSTRRNISLEMWEPRGFIAFFAGFFPASGPWIAFYAPHRSSHPRNLRIFINITLPTLLNLFLVLPYLLYCNNNMRNLY